MYDAHIVWGYDMEMCPKKGELEGDGSPLFANFGDNIWALRRPIEWRSR